MKEITKVKNLKKKNPYKACSNEYIIEKNILDNN